MKSLELKKMECDGSPLDRVVNSGGVPATNEKGEYIYLYWGVVDMLQEYDLAHKYQYCWKAVKHGCAKLPQVSVQPPELYKGKNLCISPKSKLHVSDVVTLNMLTNPRDFLSFTLFFIFISTYLSKKSGN